jgi:hypothetical protein
LRDPWVRDALMTTKWIASLFVLVLSCGPMVASGPNQTSPKEGKLIVVVTYEYDGGPARDSLVYVRGYRPLPFGEVSINLSPTRAGWFETSLPPGLYDVYVSEWSSLPMCQRMEIAGDGIEYYRARLKPDHEHMEQ